jgi:DNA replication protein
MSQGDEDRRDTIAIPRDFFEHVLPRVRDLAEMKVILVVFRLAAERRNGQPFVSEEAVYSDRPLLDGLRMQGSAKPPYDEIRRGIDLAVAHDALVRFSLGDDETGEYWVMAASAENRLVLSEIQRGVRPFPNRALPGGVPPRIDIERPNVFRLYEQNVGLVTPIIADQLIEALELYPELWIDEAIAEAVSYNRRNWRYIQRILDRWATEGRGNETDRGHKSASGSLDPDKYLRGKYASLFKRRE